MSTVPQKRDAIINSQIQDRSIQCEYANLANTKKLNSTMRILSVSQARADLSALIEEVRQGETIVITHRGSPVARIDPCTLADMPDGDRIKSLAARGLAVPGPKPIDVEKFLAAPRPTLPDGVNASDYIVEERGGSR